MKDNVNNPAHYTAGKIETIDLIDVALASSKYKYYPLGLFCVGNAIKYISRAHIKGNLVEDFKKALWYLNRASTMTAVDRATISKERLEYFWKAVEHLPAEQAAILYHIFTNDIAAAKIFIQKKINESTV